MIATLLVTCGLAAIALGTWRGYENAREALTPVVEDGHRTHAEVDAGRPPMPTARVRRFLRGAAVAVAWLAVAMYGLLLVATAGVAR